MNKILSIILIAAGVYVCALGNARRESIAGSVEATTAKVADKVTGRTHVTDATWYFVGGGVLLVAGVLGLARKSG